MKFSFSTTLLSLATSNRRVISPIKQPLSSLTNTYANSSRPFYRIYYNDIYKVNLPPRHRFPMKKYGQVRRKLQDLISDLDQEKQKLVDCHFCVSPLATFEDLATTHSKEYIQRFLDGRQTDLEQRNVGFPWSQQGVDRALSSVGGTMAAARDVCELWKARNKEGIPPWAAHVGK